MIRGVRVKQLKVLADDRGHLMEMLRRDDPQFLRFGQVYCTTVFPGVVKGWHYHKKQVDNFVCVSGQIKLVLYDARKGSATHGQVDEFVIGDHHPLLVQVPTEVYHGFKGVGTAEAVIINIPTEPYHHGQPDEYRLDPHQNDIPYDWSLRDR